MDYSNLNDLVNSRGVKVLWLSKKLGISQPYLSLILAGKRPIPSGMDARIIKILSEPIVIP